MHFPGVAARYRKNVEDIHKKYNGRFKPHFGLFWNFCLNSEFGEVERVHCMPHVDSKNIAIGLCALYIYGTLLLLFLFITNLRLIGFFNSKERSWLCIWEAGVIIELPPHSFFLYPSAIFYHFNIDVCGE